MYVDSILDEFHTAQNSVDEIMKNDKAANSIVNNVKPEDLSANIDLPSEEKLEYSPESLDYSAYLQNNWTLLSEINKAYSDGYSESKTEKEALETSAKTLSESISNINAKLKNVNVEKDAEGNYVYDAELTSLTTSLNNYNAQLSENMKEIINAANSGDGTIELLKENLATVLQCYSDTIDYYNKNLSSQLSTLTTTLSTGQYHLKLSKEMLRQALDEDDEVISGTVAVVFSDASQSNYALVNDEGVIDVSQLHMLISDLVQKNEVIYTIESADSKIGINKASVVVDNISSFQKDITYQKIENQEDGTQEYVKQDSNITAQINAIKTELDNLEKTLETFQNEQVVEIDTEAIVEDVKENVIDKLSLNAQSVSSIISAEYENQNNTLSTFENSLSAYDPFSHINQETIQTKKNMLTDNTNTLQTAMSTKDANDVMMMNKIYKQYNDNLTLLRNSITDAVDSSNQSVANGLEDVKNILNTNSGRNQELLQSFSEKLLYTRNGNLGNYRIYQYIVNPCESMNITKQNIEEKSEQIIVENDTGMDAQKMICLVGIITVIALLIAILIGALLKKQNNNNYNL